MSNGRKNFKSLKTRDPKIARFRANEIENKLAQGQSPLPDIDILAMDAFEQFKQARQGRIVESTADTDHYRIERFIKDAHIQRLNQINESRLKEHLDERISPKEGSGISHRTANHTIRVIKTFLNWAVRTNKMSNNPIAHMQRYKINQKEPRFLQQGEVRQLLEACVGTKIDMVVPIAIYTGMRQGEIMRLNWSDIDFQNKVISVRLSKPGKFRKVPLHEDLAALLKARAKKSGVIFNGTVRTLEWEFFKIKRDRIKDVEDFRFHDLRHTFASLLIKSGVDIYTVSKLLGHGQVTTTQIYSHLYQEHVQDAVSKLKL